MTSIALPESATASVVVCCHSEARYPALREAVGSVVHELAAGDEVLIVVDHNPDFQARVAATFPELRVIANSGPRGLSGARNAGIAASTGMLLVFLDDDAVAAPGLLGAIKAAAAPDGVLGVAGHVAPDWLNGRPAWFPSEMLWTVGCTYQGMRPGRVRNPIGALMAIKRAVLEATGDFVTELGRGASRLPLGCEETELCIRATRRFPGSSFIYAPEIACLHKVPASRATWRYLVTRCWAEGLSKASLATQAVSLTGLATEREYVVSTLPRAVGRGMLEGLRGDIGGVLRAVAVLIGFFTTSLAYVLGRFRMAIQSRVPARVLQAGSGHGALLTNAGALAVGTLASAVMGFAYWWVAARCFSPRAVGLASAAISVMNLLAHIGEFGLGPLLLGYLPRNRADAPAMLSTALVGVFASCAIISLCFIGLNAVLHVGLGSILSGVVPSTLFILGVASTGLTLVLDQALVAMLRSTTQMWRNIVFAGSKLALLGGLALFATRSNELTIFATWFVGQALSLVVLRRFAGVEPLWRRPRAALLRPILGDVLSHHLLNIIFQAPTLVLPLVVTVVLSPETNAAFFAAWSLVNVALLIPASLTTVLYSTGAGDPDLMAFRLRLSLVISGLLGAATSVGFLFFSPFVLGLFSPVYPLIAGTGLKVLGFGVLGVAMKYHYVALRRFAGRMNGASGLLAVGGLLELAAAAGGGHLGGLTGLTQGWVGGVFIEALAMAPFVLSAARPHTRVLSRASELEPA